MSVKITSVPYVNGQPFAQWFAGFRAQNPSLWPHALTEADFNEVMRNISRLTGQSSLSLPEFITVFLVIYNETGGQFRSMAEIGSREYIESAGPGKVAYSYKERGRGLNQLTGASNYRYVLSRIKPPHNYDALTSEQLDELFQRPSVYYASFALYLSDPGLAARYWQGISTSRDYYAFGRAISGGTAYASLFQSRAQALEAALSKATISSEWLSPRSKLALTLLILAIIGAYFFRREVWAFYQDTWNQGRRLLGKVGEGAKSLRPEG